MSNYYNFGKKIDADVLYCPQVIVEWLAMYVGVPSRGLSTKLNPLKLTEVEAFLRVPHHKRLT